MTPRPSAYATVSLLMLGLLTAAPAQTFTVLHTFKGTDGGAPLGVLTLDGAGNIYGTTSAGGVADTLAPCVSYGLGCGTVFVLNKSGRQLGLYSFRGGNGMHPSAGLLRATSGDIYGTTYFGGDFTCYEYGCGTVFKLSSTGKETVLYRFADGDSDGFFPDGPVAEDPAGNLYGTTTSGGEGVPAYGTVFEIDAQGNETILHTFAGPPANGPDGAFPVEGVIQDKSGNLYGVTTEGGTFGAGTAYKLDPSGSEAPIYSFTGGADGSFPRSVLAQDANGNIYGTTELGGNLNCGGGSGCGVVFELSPQPGGNWTENVLYTFCSLANCSDGDTPAYGPLFRDAAGNLYGTTVFGGRGCSQDGCGIVFELTPSGVETVLHSFENGSDGAYPTAGVAMDSARNLYGSTQIGGDSPCPLEAGQGCGVVFRIALPLSTALQH